MSRSQSRGREYESTGRGGVGNIRPQSRDPVPRGQGPDDFSPSRGRELRNTYDEPVTHSGRGGAGNIRSPSRDPEGERKGYEADKKLVKDYDSHQNVHSSGRGGAGNIDRSRSRDPNKTHQGGGFLSNLVHHASRDASRDRSHPTQHHTTQHHTTGRGGLGNTYDGPPVANKPEVEERNAYKNSLDDSGVHSSGRGGYGNTSSAPGAGGYDTKAPHPAPHPDNEHQAYATGRGGAGNIHDGY